MNNAQAAGIPAEFEGKVVDFHALRHTYVTQLVLGGAPLAQVQKLARHSTPTLTLAVYTHATMKDLTGALDALPPTPGAAVVEKAGAA